jgi:hypothetical protein
LAGVAGRRRAGRASAAGPETIGAGASLPGSSAGIFSFEAVYFYDISHYATIKICFSKNIY